MTRLVLASAVILTALVSASPHAFAQTATTPTTAGKPQEINSWALTPTGTDPNEPGSRPNFAYTLAPGGSVNDSLTVWNYSNVQMTFHVYATDAFNTASDGFDLITVRQKPKDVGSWIHIKQNYITLPASSKAAIPFTLKVPENATPGDHAGGIVAASQTTAVSKGGNVALDRRTGTRVYLRVSGPVTPALVVEHLSTKYHAAINPLGGSLDVAYTVRNNGNIRLGAHQKVTISDVFGKVAARKPRDLPDLLPGNAVTITEHFTGVAATLRVEALVNLAPFVPKGSGQATPATLKPTSASASTWAIPWLILVLLAVLGIVIVVLRRRKAGQAPPPPNAPPEGPPPAAPTPVSSGVSS